MKRWTSFKKSSSVVFEFFGQIRKNSSMCSFVMYSHFDINILKLPRVLKFICDSIICNRELDDRREKEKQRNTFNQLSSKTPKSGRFFDQGQQ